MKKQISFDLNDPEDKIYYDRVNQADNMYFCLVAFLSVLGSDIKYRKASGMAELNNTELKIYRELKQYLVSVLDQYGVNMEKEHESQLRL